MRYAYRVDTMTVASTGPDKGELQGGDLRPGERIVQILGQESQGRAERWRVLLERPADS